MRTIVYIDGFNFYFGVLRNTGHKWLDIVSLVKHICHVQNSQIELIAVKFFTAPVITRVATKGDRPYTPKTFIIRPLKTVIQRLLR